MTEFAQRAHQRGADRLVVLDEQQGGHRRGW
jgi:hypothetical protein